jgi:hypothetical protein
MRKIILLAIVLLVMASSCIYYTAAPPSTLPQQSTPPTIVAFTAVPASISPGSPVTLAWTVVNGTTINIDQGIGTVNAIGGTTVTPATTTTYTLTAGNAYGSVYATAQVVVSSQAGGLPVINEFTATPSVVTAGNYVTLHWNITGASSVFISGVGGGFGATGSTMVAPLAPTVYTLTATNGYGTSTATVQVSTGGASYGTTGGNGTPVVQVFRIRPDVIRYGDSTLLTWQVDGATSIYISGIGNVGPTGQQVIFPVSTTGYTISASNAYGTVNSNALVTVTN